MDIWDKHADKSKFICERTDKNKCIRFPMTVLKNVNTTFILSHSMDDDICQGVKMDIRFLDGVPKGMIGSKINEMCAMFLALLRTERLPNHTSRVKYIISKLVLTTLPTHRIRWEVSKFLEKRLKKFDFDEDCEFVRYLTLKIKKSALNNIIEADFEGFKMPIPEGYDEILKSQYGDYMRLPPEDKRHSRIANLVFYDLDHSYLDYKGKYVTVR